MCALFHLGNCTAFSVKDAAVATFFISQQNFNTCNILQTSILQINENSQLLLKNEPILTPKSSNLADVDFYE